MNRKLVYLFLLALGLRLLLAPLIWHPDLNNHVDWGIRFFDYGARNFYAPDSNVWGFTWPNQPPGAMLIFALIYKLYRLLFFIVEWINQNISFFPSTVMPFFEHNFYQAMLKLPSIISDFGIAYVIFLFLKENSRKLAVFGATLFLFNPVIWYNSAVWGQTDAVINFLFILSFWFLARKKLVPSLIFISLCLYIKISLAILLPVYFIFLIRNKPNFSKILIGSALSLLLIVALTLSFSGDSEPITWLFGIYKEKVLTNQLQVINANAFNLWASFTGIALKPHSLSLGPLSYQMWGYILFGASIVPVLINLWKRADEKNAIRAFFIITFSSWLLLTNMHERYLYPAFPFFTILVAQNRKLLIYYIGLMLINLLNLFNLWWVPSISIMKNVLEYSDFLIARLFGLINTGIFLVLYKKNIIDSWGAQK